MAGRIVLRVVIESEDECEHNVAGGDLAKPESTPGKLPALEEHRAEIARSCGGGALDEIAKQLCERNTRRKLRAAGWKEHRVKISSRWRMKARRR